MQEYALKREGTDECYSLPLNKNKFVIGRNPNCDIVFTSHYVSRQHCEILRIPPHGTLIIRNLRATNKTHVDSIDLGSSDSSAELRVGSRIGLGVPLEQANAEGIQNEQFVFLRLCSSEDEAHNQTVEYSPRTHPGVRIQTPVEYLPHTSPGTRIQAPVTEGGLQQTVQNPPLQSRQISSNSQELNAARVHSRLVQQGLQSTNQPQAVQRPAGLAPSLLTRPQVFRQSSVPDQPKQQRSLQQDAVLLPKQVDCGIKGAVPRSHPLTCHQAPPQQQPSTSRLVPQIQNRIQVPLSDIHVEDSHYENLETKTEIRSVRDRTFSAENDPTETVSNCAAPPLVTQRRGRQLISDKPSSKQRFLSNEEGSLPVSDKSDSFQNNHPSTSKASRRHSIETLHRQGAVYEKRNDIAIQNNNQEKGLPVADGNCQGQQLTAQSGVFVTGKSSFTSDEGISHLNNPLNGHKEGELRRLGDEVVASDIKSSWKTPLKASIPSPQLHNQIIGKICLKSTAVGVGTETHIAHETLPDKNGATSHTTLQKNAVIVKQEPISESHCSTDHNKFIINQHQKLPVISVKQERGLSNDIIVKQELGVSNEETSSINTANVTTENHIPDKDSITIDANVSSISKEISRNRQCDIENDSVTVIDTEPDSPESINLTQPDPVNPSIVCKSRADIEDLSFEEDNDDEDCYLNSLTMGRKLRNPKSGQKSELQGKRKRDAREELSEYEENKINTEENCFKKVRPSSQSTKNPTVLQDFDSNSDIELQQSTRRKRKGRVILSDSDSDTNTGTVRKKEEDILNAKKTKLLNENLSMTETPLNDSCNKRCKVSLKKLPVHIIDGVKKGKGIVGTNVDDVALISPVLGKSPLIPDVRTTPKNIHECESDDDDLPDLNESLFTNSKSKFMSSTPCRAQVTSVKPKENIQEENGSDDGEISNENLATGKVSRQNNSKNSRVKTTKRPKSSDESYLGTNKKSSTSTTSKSLDASGKTSVHSVCDKSLQVDKDKCLNEFPTEFSDYDDIDDDSLFINERRIFMSSTPCRNQSTTKSKEQLSKENSHSDNERSIGKTAKDEGNKQKNKGKNQAGKDKSRRPTDDVDIGTNSKNSSSNASTSSSMAGRTTRESMNANKEKSIEDFSVESIVRDKDIIKKEKLDSEDRGVKKIKQEKLDTDRKLESNTCNIKKEPDENFSSLPSSNENDNDNDSDDDDVIMIYSQIDETIWVSSDEEDTSSKENISFGPPPSSPELNLEELFKEENELSKDELLPDVNECKDKEELGEQWFPILSQEFWDGDDDQLMEHVNEAENKSSQEKLTEAIPGPSGHKEIAFDSNRSNDANSLIPTSDFMKENVLDSSEESRIEALKEKLKSHTVRKAQLTDPKTPPSRTKSQNHKVKSSNDKESTSRSRSNSSEKSHAIFQDTKEARTSKDRRRRVDDSAVLKDKKTESSSKRTSLTPPHRRKGPGLRDNLKSKYNLDCYKRGPTQKSKNSHHLAEKRSECVKRKPEHSSTVSDKPHKAEKRKQEHSSTISDKPHSDENISIQKRIPKKIDEMSKTKVAAKVTKSSRSQKLTEVNLFPSPLVQKPHCKPKQKIPTTAESKTSKKSSESDQNKTSEAGKSPLERRCPSPEQSVSKASSSVAPIDEDASHDKENDGQDNNLSDGKNLSESCKNVKKGIMKKIYKGRKASKKSVHFPEDVNDLVKTLYISPRKNCERAGIPEVRARELMPREHMVKWNQIPVNPFYHFVQYVCNWNYDWLEAYRGAQEKREKNGKPGSVRPPPVVNSTNYPTLILYNSYKDYKDIFSTLMYLEVWENIYQDWLKYRDSNCYLPTLIDVVKPVTHQDDSENFMLWEITMFSLITQEQSERNLHPRDGCLISLKLQQGAKRSHVFGYVTEYGKQRKRMISKELEEACPNGQLCLTLKVQVSKEILQDKRGKIISVSNVSYLRQSIRVWEGLSYLPSSPLCSDLLRPSPEIFSCDCEEGKYLVKDMPLNDVQRKAVVDVSNKCVLNSKKAKISIIHGPPGTGKTRTITALIAQITKQCQLLQSPVCRILLCAPSNAAVDELTLRLLRLRDVNIPLRVVRVGVKSSISQQVQSCTLDTFVQNQIRKELTTPRNVSTRQEWDRLKMLVGTAAEKLQKAREERKDQQHIKFLETNLNELVRNKERFERSFQSEPSAQEKHFLQQKWQREILVGAEVITTTLGGCRSGALEDVFRHTNSFTCCIVDEAGQCKETEMWLPLLYGINKLVLVGDHQQLPATVLSKIAQDKNLKQSLFQRLHHRFVLELQQEHLIHMLNVQYRMHPDISLWPSEQFYLGKLSTCQDIVPRRTWELKPYIVFDLKDSKEQKNRHNEIYNPAEANFIRLILESMEPTLRNQKVGIVTPYFAQKLHLQETLKSFADRIRNITINTIDAFQGQERDVVILSFVRANNNANIGFLAERQRLNVALTRARKSCYIVTHVDSVKHNSEWKSLLKNAYSRGLIQQVTAADHNNTFIKNVVAIKKK